MAHKTIEKGHRTVMRPGGGQLCPNSEFAAADPLGGTGNLPVAAGYQPPVRGRRPGAKRGAAMATGGGEARRAGSRCHPDRFRPQFSSDFGGPRRAA